MKKGIVYLLIGMFLVGNISGQPRLWNLSKLNSALTENPSIKNQIVKIADKLLKKNILSVVDKEKPAPSGDMHDYISCAPYYWPDSVNPTGKYVRRDGVKNVAVTTPDKNNMGTMANSIISLSLAYYLTLKEIYAAKAVENLRIWFINPKTKMNPNLNFGQTIQGYFDGKGRGAGLIETYKLVEMLDGVELLRNSPTFSQTDQENLSKWFDDFLNWMMTSEVGNQEYNAKNNHGTAFDVQVIRYALFVGREDIARKYLTDFPARRMFTQIEPDGKQPAELVRTKALHYSVFNLIHILDLCFIAKTMNVNLFEQKSDDGRSILKALEFLTQFAGKQKESFPYQQINGWEDSQKTLQLQLYRADILAGKALFKKYYLTKLHSINEIQIYY